MSLTAGTQLGPYEIVNAPPSWGVTSDGQRFLIAVSPVASLDASITVILNWPSALAR